MRVLVCGDRHWTDAMFLWTQLSNFHLEHTITGLIEGDAPGADKLAGIWGVRNHIVVNRFPAQWNTYGKAAGPIRNQEMLDKGQPEHVIAFHDSLSLSKGTKDMVERAKRVGIPVTVVTHGTPLR